MDETRAQRIEDKLDKVIDVLKDQAVLHERQTVTLEIHVKRTNALEDLLKPIQQTDSAIRFTLKAVAFIGVILTLIATYKGLK